jgi:hypothetical protein
MQPGAAPIAMKAAIAVSARTTRTNAAKKSINDVRSLYGRGDTANLESLVDHLVYSAA